MAEDLAGHNLHWEAKDRGDLADAGHCYSRIPALLVSSDTDEWLVLRMLCDEVEHHRTYHLNL